MENQTPKPTTLIFSFKVVRHGGRSSGRVEATDAAHAQRRIEQEFNPISGNIKLLANQEAARKQPFWKIEDATL